MLSLKKVVDESNDWTKWTADLAGRIECSDMDGAANMLACCTKEPDFSARDIAGHEVMFTHPLVLERAKDLWPLVRGLTCKQFRDKVRREVKKAGWIIR